MRKVLPNAIKTLTDKLLDVSLSAFLAWLVPAVVAIFGAIQAESIYQFLSTRQLSAGSACLIALAFLLAGYLLGRIVHKPKPKPGKKREFEFRKIGKYEVKMLFEDGKYAGLAREAYCAKHETKMIHGGQEAGFMSPSRLICPMYQDCRCDILVNDLMVMLASAHSSIASHIERASPNRIG